MIGAGASRASLLEAMVLAMWLGAALLLATTVAPAAFAVLPTRADAGALVGRILPVLFLSGIAVAAVIAVSLMRRRDRRRSRFVAVGVVALSCAIAQFGVAPRIATVRASITGSIESLPMTDARRASFGRLHAISVGWLGLAMVGAASLAISFVRASSPSVPSASNHP